MTPEPQVQAQPAIIPSAPAPRPQRDTMKLLEMVMSATDERSGAESRANFAKDLIAAEITRDTFDQDYRLAKVFAMSGEFGDLKNKTEDQAISGAMAKIQLGRHWGILPPDAMRFIHFINGKPSVEAEAIAAKMMDAGWSWDLVFDKDEDGRCIGCHLYPKKRDANGNPVALRDRAGAEVEVAFTYKEAERAIINDGGKQIRLIDKWNFKSWPEDMYFARCITRMKKRYAPNILSGVVSPEEASDAGETDMPVGSQAEADKVLADKLDEIKKRGAQIHEVKAVPPEPHNRIPFERRQPKDLPPTNDRQGKQAVTTAGGETVSGKEPERHDEIPHPATTTVVETMKVYMDGAGPDRWAQILTKHGHALPGTDEEVLANFTAEDLAKMRDDFEAAAKERAAKPRTGRMKA